MQAQNSHIVAEGALQLAAEAHFACACVGFSSHGMFLYKSCIWFKEVTSAHPVLRQQATHNDSSPGLLATLARNTVP
jgi:hypothetical protein